MNVQECFADQLIYLKNIDNNMLKQYRPWSNGLDVHAGLDIFSGVSLFDSTVKVTGCHGTGCHDYIMFQEEIYVNVMMMV